MGYLSYQLFEYYDIDYDIIGWLKFTEIYYDHNDNHNELLNFAELFEDTMTVIISEISPLLSTIQPFSILIY